MMRQAILKENREITDKLLDYGFAPTTDDITNYFSNNKLNSEFLELLILTGIGYPEIYQKEIDAAFINDNYDTLNVLEKWFDPSKEATIEKKRLQKAEEVRIAKEKRAEQQRLARINIMNGTCAAGMENDKNCYENGRRVKCSAYRISYGQRYFISFEYFCVSGEAYMKALGESDRQADRYSALDRCCVSH